VSLRGKIVSDGGACVITRGANIILIPFSTKGYWEEAQHGHFSFNTQQTNDENFENYREKKKE